MIMLMVVSLSPLHEQYGHKRGGASFSLREKQRYVGARLDSRFHTDTSALHAKTLAALGTTSSEDGTATLGRHTCTEAVGLGALALIRLIGALHIFSLSRSNKFILK